MSTETRNTKTKGDEPSDKKGPIVTKVGNLVADPELRFGANGTAYCRLRLAVSAPVEEGNWAGERRSTFYDLTAFKSLAENAAESLHKGDRVLVTGRGEDRTWTGDAGVEHTEKGILADALGPDLRFATVKITKEARGRFPSERGGHDADEEPF